MPAPAQKTPVVALQTGRDVRGDQRGLDGQGARTAHRIQKAAAGCRNSRPTGAQQYSGRQIFAQWRFTTTLTVAAPMQAFAREINIQANLRAVGVRHHFDGRSLELDVGARTGTVTQLIADAILELERTKMAVGNGRVGTRKFAGQCLRRVEVRAPVDGAYRSVKGVGGGGIDMRHLQQHTAGHARVQTGGVALRQRTLKQNAAGTFAHLADAERAQFARHQIGQAARRGGHVLQ